MVVTLNGLRGGTVISVPLVTGQGLVQPNGTVLPNSSTAGTFFVSGMGSNQRFYQGEDAQANTKTDVMWGAVQLPDNYCSGQAISIRIGAGISGSGTLGTCTVACSLFKQAVDASVGSDLVTTGATAITTVFGNKDFTVTPTGLVAGDYFMVKITTAVQETGGIAAIRSLLTNLFLRPTVTQP